MTTASGEDASAMFCRSRCGGWLGWKEYHREYCRRMIACNDYRKEMTQRADSESKDESKKRHRVA
jgi:hypothetical protein